MNRALRTIAMSLVAAAILSCASVPTPEAPFSPVGTGDSLTADSVVMSSRTTDVSWDDTVQVATITPGTKEGGVDSIEISIFYGETAMAWNFSGLTPNAPVTLKFDANFEFFATASYFEITCMPGTQPADVAYESRETLDDSLVLKWADGDPKWPDSTGGWKTITWTGGRADANGRLSVIMVAGHTTEDPPVVHEYFTNPVVKSAQ